MLILDSVNRNEGNGSSIQFINGTYDGIETGGGAGYMAAIAGIDDYGFDGRLEFRVSNDNSQTSSPLTSSDTVMVIKQTGNVGIGMISPEAKLSVESEAIAQGYTVNENMDSYFPNSTLDRAASTIVGVNTSDPVDLGDLSVGVYGEATDNFANDTCPHTFKGWGVYGVGYGDRGVGGVFKSAEGFGLWVEGGKPARFNGGLNVMYGRLGIGTTEPDAKLEIKQGSGGRGILLYTPFYEPWVDAANAPSITWQVDNVNNRYMIRYFYDENNDFAMSGLRFGKQTGEGIGSFSQQVIFTDTGNVGIGTTAPGSYKLYVNGAAYSTGGWSSSDERLKKNITPLKESLYKVN